METSLHNVPNELMAAKAPHHDESTAIFIHKYLTNNNYRSLIAVSLIFMFSLVFYLFYLLVDAFIDKQKHYELCVKSFERYEKRCRAKAKMLAKQQQQQQQGEQNDEQAINDKAEELENPKDIELGENENEMAKSKAQERERKLAFTEWSTRNLQISFIHSVLSSLWLIRIFIVRYEPLLADLVFYVSWDTYLLVAFSAGYFLYDFYDIYANGYVKREWVVCLHHVIVLISFTYHLCMLQSIGYTCLALAMEFNSVFLHARKLLSFYMFGKRSLAYLVNMVGNVTTFVTFRFGTLGLIYFGIYRDGPRVPLTYLVVLILLVSMMAIINVLLFRRVVQRDVLPLICGPSSCSSARKHKKSKKAKNQQQHDDAAPIDDKATLMVDHHGHLLTSDNLPIINNAQSNVVLVMVE